MSFINIEIKARTTHTATIQYILLMLIFIGTDLQTDTYFSMYPTDL